MTYIRYFNKSTHNWGIWKLSVDMNDQASVAYSTRTMPSLTTMPSPRVGIIITTDSMLKGLSDECKVDVLTTKETEDFIFLEKL